VHRLSRRDFLKLTGGAAVGAAILGATMSRSVETPTRTPERRETAPLPGGGAYLAVATGPDSTLITRRAVAALGGMGRFVQRGDDVIVKPNICNGYHGYQYASTTNPWVCAAVVSMCREAGAARVRVMDNPFGGTPEHAYAVSGIGAAVAQAGGEMVIMSPAKYETYTIPAGRDIRSWPVYSDILDCDALINVPIAKQHGLARLTLGGKNLIGTVLHAGQLHWNLGQRVADLVSLVRPTLTVVDAVRILTHGGPTGGDLAAARQLDTVIASHDTVAADTAAAALFDVRPGDVAYLPQAAAMGLGTMRIDRVKVARITS
jgi:uncharacterized protein (DUF362 family)